MKDQRARIVEDLSGVLEGDLRCDPLTIAMYSSDASLYQIAPLAVVYPRHQQDVQLVAKYCSESRIPLMPRGAGSGLAGESLGRGILLDFTRYMRRVLAVHAETVRVQPGVVLQDLNQQLRPYGRYFPPDPSRQDVTTLGSMMAVDAAGSHSIRVGSTRDHVLSLETVLAGGVLHEFADEPYSNLPESTSRYPYEESPDSCVVSWEQKSRLLGRLVKILNDQADLIREYQPPLLRNRCGYYLRNLLSDKTVHMPRLLVGSEGTLGIFTEATLHTTPLPGHRALLLLLFQNFETASKAVHEITFLEPSACDLLDRRVLSLARESDERFALVISPDAEAALIVEQIGFTEEQARDRIRQVVVALKHISPQPVVAHVAYTPEEVDFLWSLPHKVVPLLAKMPGNFRPLPFVEDIAVPPEALQDFLVSAQNVFKSHAVTATLYSHAAAGQVHFRPIMTCIPTSADFERMEALAENLYREVFAVGGTISGEHATGLSRSAFIERQYGPLYSVFAEIKKLFDPQNILNPGKVINDDPHLMLKDVRPVLTTIPETVPLQLNWKPGELVSETNRCNGCGACRTHDTAQRMCPIFRLEGTEEASPRAKANLMRALGLGQLRPDELASQDMKRIADLCFNCKQCQVECPSGVNIPQMMIEAKAAYVEANGLSRTDWILSRLHLFGGLLSLSPWLTNAILQSPTARWVIQRLFGLSAQRKLPRFAHRTFLSYARRELLTKPVRWNEQKAVVYFVDHYVNYYDPQLGRALVNVLRHHGIPVYVPPNQVPSGMALISAGDLGAARSLAEKNVRVLAEFAREGIPIICTEPAAALALKFEYPKLLDHPEVQLVADHVVEAGAYLWQLREAGKFRTDFQPLNLQLGYHTPCHLKALGQGTPLEELVRMIPQLELHDIDEGCSGMAGTYGLSAANYRNSLRIGMGLISRMRRNDLHAGLTECSSCKLQMEQGTEIPTLHPLKLLALAYGVMPDIARRLKPNKRRLMVS